MPDVHNAPLRFRFNPWHIGVWLLTFLFIGGWRLLHVEASPQKALTLYAIFGRIFGQ